MDGYEIIISILIAIIVTIIIDKYSHGAWWIVIAIVYISGVLSYYFGYRGNLEICLNNESIVDVIWAMIASASMFSFNNQFGTLQSSVIKDNIFLGWFWGNHFFAMICTLVTVFYLVKNRVYNYFRILKYLLSDTIYIFLGTNLENVTFIKYLNLSIDNKKSCILLVDDDDEYLKQNDEIDILKVGNIKASIYDKKVLSRYVFSNRLRNKKRYIMLLGECSCKNIEAMINLSEIKKSCNLHKDKVKVIGQVTQVNWSGYIDPQHVLDLNLFTKADIMVNQLIDLCPSYEVINIDTTTGLALSDYTLLIIGFDEVGQQALLRMTSLAQYEGNKFKAIVIDRDMFKLKGKFARQYPAFLEQYEILFYEMSSDSEEFNELLIKWINNISCIVICMMDDEDNLELASQIYRLINKLDLKDKKQIAAKYCNGTRLTQMIHEDNIELATVKLFGRLDEIFTTDILINEKLDIRAKAINDYYNENNPDYATSWEDLSYFLKDSNRHAAMHVLNKIALVDLRIVKKDRVVREDECITTKDELERYLGKERLERLARVEHLRWNAFYFSNGWETMPLEEAIRPKDKQKKRHACLVKWDDLDRVFEKFGEDEKEKDRVVVKEIVDYLAKTDEVLVINNSTVC